jgi:glyoxylase-like metal-dependent hydrolase (beta-lactamase superfamily II)
MVRTCEELADYYTRYNEIPESSALLTGTSIIPPDDVSLADGDTVRIGDEDCEVVYTPGHAEDHVSLVSEASLFSGDVVVHDDSAFEGGSFGRTDYPGQSRERLIESIRELLERMPGGVEHMYSGHGSVFHGDVREIVERALERAERREPKYPDE